MRKKVLICALSGLLFVLAVIAAAFNGWGETAGNAIRFGPCRNPLCNRIQDQAGNYCSLECEYADEDPVTERVEAKVTQWLSQKSPKGGGK